jgi:hypothetical protein
MPSFDFSTSIDFEVFCGTCGAGLCGQSDTRISRSRGHNQVTVDACDKCLESAREDGANDKEKELESYYSKEIEQLKDEIEQLKFNLSLVH